MSLINHLVGPQPLVQRLQRNAGAIAHASWLAAFADAVRSNSAQLIAASPPPRHPHLNLSVVTTMAVSDRLDQSLAAAR
jgi:hypothetical protein